MKNLLNEPFLSLNSTIIFLLLSLTGSIFLWILSYPYGDATNLQFGHLLDDNLRPRAVRNLRMASLFYAVLTALMIFELVVHLRKNRRESWDPSIAMVNVHTPKGPKRPTSALPGDSSTNLSLGESQADLRTGQQRQRKTTNIN